MKSKSSLSHRSQEPENCVLYIVGTPIGNLEDISFRALKILKSVSLIACEDTRQTRKIMNKFKIENNLVSFNKENGYKKIPKLINYLQSGKSLALVSDAGMPSICDPGEDLVRNAKINGIDAICIPGPCAAINALISSGMPSSSFIFEGFLPKKKKDREAILLEISKRQKTTILFESPHRLLKLLKEIKDFCGGEREIQVSREITKKYEEHLNFSVNKVIEYLERKEVVGEITLVIKGIGIKDSEFNEYLLKKELYELINAGLSLSAASSYLANKKNLTKNKIYNLY
tara:strand:+ start:874 stop:1734 length:861 start_codon:yes stop_codon:yes gene_type:complete